MGVVISGLDNLTLDLKDLIEMPESVTERMLKAGAEVISQEQAKTARAMGVYDNTARHKGTHVAESIKVSKVTRRADEAKVFVTPTGSRTRGNKTISNAEIAFLNEYGKRTQPARPFMRTANAAAGSRAQDAAEAVYHEYLDSKNL